MIFVTGATGLLGSHLLYFLAGSGQEVLALRRKERSVEKIKAVFYGYPDSDILWQRIVWVEGDILDRQMLAGCVEKATIVYHCAAVVSFDGADRESLERTNLQGSGLIAELCVEYGARLCYVSSIAALGDAPESSEHVDEDTPVIAGTQHSVYSRSKANAEKIVWKYIRKGMNGVIVNPSIILGAGQWERSSGRLFLTAAKGMPVYTGGVNGYVDVRDVCELMIRLAEDREVSGERFVLNGGNYSYLELFREIARSVGRRPPRFYMAPVLTSAVWRILAVWGKLTGRKPAFTRETARSSHHKSCYSSRKILTRYPDFHFRTLQETIEWMAGLWKKEN